MAPDAGYSGTPLAKKLGITPGARVVVTGEAPADVERLLDPLPDSVRIGRRLRAGDVDVAWFFTSSRAALEKRLPALRSAIEPDGAIWVSWPKRTSNVPTDMTEDVIREVALPTGLVDNKVCAVDETWSGLRLVVRKELRGGR